MDLGVQQLCLELRDLVLGLSKHALQCRDLLLGLIQIVFLEQGVRQLQAKLRNLGLRLHQQALQRCDFLIEGVRVLLSSVLEGGKLRLALLELRKKTIPLLAQLGDPALGRSPVGLPLYRLRTELLSMLYT